MSREFGVYSPSVELFTTWEEDLQIVDEAGPVNIGGLDIVAHLRLEKPIVLPAPAPVLELTTTGYHTVAPTYPSIAAFVVTDALNGRFRVNALPDEYSEIVSPSNARMKLYWDIKLVNKSTGHAVPVIRGRVVFKPATTIP